MGDRLYDRKKIIAAVIDLSNQHPLGRFRTFALRNVTANRCGGGN